MQLNWLLKINIYQVHIAYKMFDYMSGNYVLLIYILYLIKNYKLK